MLGIAHTLKYDQMVAIIMHTLLSKPNFHLETGQTVEMLSKMPTVEQSLISN